MTTYKSAHNIKFSQSLVQGLSGLSFSRCFGIRNLSLYPCFLCENKVPRVSLWKQGRGKEGVPYDSWYSSFAVLRRTGAGKIPDKPACRQAGGNDTTCAIIYDAVYRIPRGATVVYTTLCTISYCGKKPFILILRKRSSYIPPKNHPWRRFKPAIQNNSCQPKELTVTQIWKPDISILVKTGYF